MMKKIRLNPDALRVETFETDAVAGAQGTVHAHEGASGVSCTYNCTQGELTCGVAGCRTIPLVTCLC